MNTELMQKVQRSGDSVWTLPERASMTLQVGPGQRVLQVCAGRLWLTSAGNEDEESVDVWLEAGESLELPHGLELVVEAWPSARFQLLVPPSACRNAGGAPLPGSRWLGWARRHLQSLASPVMPLARH